MGNAGRHTHSQGGLYLVIGTMCVLTHTVQGTKVSQRTTRPPVARSGRQDAGHGPSRNPTTVAAEVAAEVAVAEVAIEITTPCQLATRCNIHRDETTTTGRGRGGLTFKTTAASK